MAKTMMCTVCGSAGRPKRIARGSIGVEIVLWICFILPGLIYSIWRLTTKQNGCRACGATQLVPTDSPAGRRLSAERR